MDRAACVEASNGLRLAFEPSLELEADVRARRQNLDGHDPIETSVTRLVDTSHTAGADFAEDGKRAERVPLIQSHRRIPALTTADQS